MESNPDQGPAGGITAHLQVGGRRASEAIDFYAAAFGATELMRNVADDGERLMHAHLSINGESLMLHDEFPEYVDPANRNDGPPRGVTLHLQVDDADAWYARATAAGAKTIMPVADMFWGDRYGQLMDPFGHSWSIGSSTTKQGESR